ncbi:MAG: DUF1579 family protein [Planctomycetota bacterium]
MNRQAVSSVVLAAFAGILLTGCMPKMTIEKMKEMRPERPAELDKLNAFVGRWDMSGEATMAGLDQPLKASGTGETKWEGDGWYLVSQFVHNMEELGESKGMETWSYDARSKKYRTLWVDSMGSVGVGTAWHDEKTDTWQFRGTSHGPFGKSTGKGEGKFVDANTMEWEWSEYAMWGLIKTMSIKGTSKKQ